jgi:uncharacterized membrane protein YfcA
VITPDFAQIGWTALAGVVAGLLGALLGIGGGVFLVPFLTFAIGLDPKSAGGISLITIIATSSITSATPGRLHVANLRLGMVLEMFTTTGAIAGIVLFSHLSNRTIEWVFGWTMVAISGVMLNRLHKRNVILDPTMDVGALGGRFHDIDTGQDVAYRLKRLPVACVASFAAGVVSRMGLGGGIVKVPALNSWCGVPMRAATATSALMLGATAMIGAIDAFWRGQIVPGLAASAVLGVLLGSWTGFHIAGRSAVKSHKVLMIVVLLSVAGLYFYQVLFGEVRP